MRCDNAVALLSDYSDRSLLPLAAWRVRRHLKTCADCQKAWEQTQAWEQEVRGLYAENSAPPPDLRARVLSLAAYTLPNPIARSRRYSRAEWAALSVCAGLVVFSVAGLTYLSYRVPGIAGHPTVAFAQVEAAMQNVQTVHWIEKSRSAFREGEPLGRVRITEKWARLEPPVLVVKRLPGETPPPPSTRDNYFHTLIDGQRQVTHDSIGDVYTITDFMHAENKDKDKRTQIMRNWIISETISPGAMSAYVRAMTKKGAAKPQAKKSPPWLPKTSAWKSGILTEAGRRLVLFERTQQAWKMPPSGERTLAFGPTIEQTWVEPDTHRIVRHERTQYFPNEREIAYQTTSEQFRYNETLPPSTFVLVPPPGAKVKQEEERMAQPVWRKLPARERQKIKAAIAASDAGWRTGHFAAFATVWDFGYLHTRAASLDTGPVRRQQWAFRVAHQKNNWAEWRSTVTGASQQNFVDGATFAFGSPNLLRVDVLVEGRPNRAGRPRWQGPATFYLNRAPNGTYKVVEWEWQSLWHTKALPSLLPR